MDTTDLRKLTTAGGPFASVHFNESHDTEDAGKRLQLRAKEIEAALDEQGADQPTVDAILRTVRDGTPPVGRAGRSVLAAHGAIVVDRRLAAPPAAQEARYSALPYFMPIVTHTEDVPAHLVVLVDRVGADIEVHHPGGTSETETVRGHDHPVHKVRGGGPAHRDIQSRAEETAGHNFEDVAGHVAKTAERTGARLIVIAGEVPARTELHDLLPDPARRIATAVDTGGRAPGSDRAELDRRIHELLTGRHLVEVDDLAERFRAELSRGSGSR